jgi:Leucine-rich repeat (LRR) protein
MHHTRLEQLTMGKNDSVTTIDSLRYLVNLRYLDIHANNVRDLYTAQNFTRLVKLVAYRNQLTDISPLLNCRELRSLFIQGNPIVDYGPLYQMGYIQHLYLNKKHFDATQQANLKKALRTTNLSFE